MGTVLAKTLTESPAREAARAQLHRHERVILLFFLFLAGVGFGRSIELRRQAVLLAIPAVVWALCRLDAQAPRRWSGVAREWAALAIILPAYWSVEFFSQSYAAAWQESWIRWDRWLLLDAGLKYGIEAAGALIPVLLETAYLLLYAIPPISLGVLYACGERRRVPQFLQVMLLGTLTAYALLPLLPVESPRVAFAGTDLPLFSGFPRSLNVWLLDHLDISTSVFPSGHVAVAFSCAFGLARAIPRRRAVWLAALGVAVLVFVATIYGRYHYAADGLASIAIAAMAWRLAHRMWGDVD